MTTSIENSRFITYPSLVDKSSNHTVVIIDASEEDIEDIGLFCKLSDKNYDIYLYRGDLNDLEWLSYISDRADSMLLKDDSKVTTTAKHQKFGQSSEQTSPLEYFQKYDLC